MWTRGLQPDGTCPKYRSPDEAGIVPPEQARRSTMSTRNSSTQQSVLSTIATALNSSWAEQNAFGRAYAERTVREMAAKQAPCLLHHARQQIADAGAPEGVLVGFDQVIAAAAI